MHFIRPVGNPQRADAGIHARQTEILGHTAAAMRLNGITDFVGNALASHFVLGNLAFRHLIADRIHHIGGFHGQKAWSFRYWCALPAMRCSQMPLSATTLPKAVRLISLVHIFSSARSATPTSACNGESAPGQAALEQSQSHGLRRAAGFQPARGHSSNTSA